MRDGEEGRGKVHRMMGYKVALAKKDTPYYFNVVRKGVLKRD